MSSPARHPKGTPSSLGGQFRSTDHHESDVALADAGTDERSTRERAEAALSWFAMGQDTPPTVELIDDYVAVRLDECTISLTIGMDDGGVTVTHLDGEEFGLAEYLEPFDHWTGDERDGVGLAVQSCMYDLASWANAGAADAVASLNASLGRTDPEVLEKYALLVDEWDYSHTRLTELADGDSTGVWRDELEQSTERGFDLLRRIAAVTRESHDGRLV